MRILLVLFFATSALAQFDWSANGVPVRQGLHLGWNGAMTPSGDDVTLFYYHGQRDGTRDVWGQRIDGSGAHRWATDGQLVAANRSEQRAPLTAAYADGSTLVVWEDYQPGRYRDLYAQRYNSSGQPLWSPAEGVAIVVAQRDQYDPDLALDENGIAYVVFTDDRETTGINVRLGAYAQVIDPDGIVRGPADGIQLMDRLYGSNIPGAVVATNGAGFALISAVNLDQTDVVLQKILPDGTIAWPEDPALFSLPDGSLPVIAPILNGLAVGFTDRTADIDGDARLMLIDLDRTPLPGWTAEGLPVESGARTQAVVKLLETSPGGDIAVATASFDYDANSSLATVRRYTRDGGVVHAPVILGPANLNNSPFVMIRQSTAGPMILAWAERSEDIHYRVRTQALSATGQLLWGDHGNLLWERTSKELRVDLAAGANGPQITIVSGRSVTRPESLWVARLNNQGQFAADPDLLAGGITYDSYDPKLVRMAGDQALYVWTDTREHLNRDVYVQILDWRGRPRLGDQGQRVTHGELTIQLPPAACADGSDGAFIAWAGDSSGAYNVLNIQRLYGDGTTPWATPARLESTGGVIGELKLLPDDQQGVFIAYTAYNEAFITRTRVAHVNAEGAFDWPTPYRDFDWPAIYDMTLGDAVADGQGGIFAVASVGSWQDPDLRLFHVARDGSPGANWSWSGQGIGYAGARDYSPRLLQLGDGVVLCFLRLNPDLATGTLRALTIHTDGSLPWGQTPRALIGDNVRILEPQLAQDGTGGFLLGWEDFQQSEFASVRVARFTANGESLWPTGGVRPCLTDGEQRGFALTTDSSGGAWVSWEDDRHSDDYPEWDLYATHLNADGQFASINGFTWPETGAPMCDLPTYQQEVTLIPWVQGSALAVWRDLRSSNPGRCCGAGAVGDIFQNIYTQVLSEISLAAEEPRDAGSIARNFAITSAYPNPFNPTTTIRFDLPAATDIKLAIYNTLGREVTVLNDGLRSAGTHEIVWNAAELPTGLYFARLESANSTSVRKLLLLK
ncbi:T9SS type A sorting domain-containing protein [candidate division KSB1 bacterium]|nr:T9SS type A sorting domain-containing protein [candidate division KSB1 bacterium]